MLDTLITGAGAGLGPTSVIVVHVAPSVFVSWMRGRSVAGSRAVVDGDDVAVVDTPPTRVGTMTTVGQQSRGATLRVLKGFYEGLEVAIDRDRLVIGRGREADLAVAEPTISRQHAAIEWDGDGYTLQDLGSTNGSRVNGRRETRARLRDGDEIELGRLQLRLCAPAFAARG